MSLRMIEGEPGSGKSYVAVNVLLVDALTKTDRHIYTNLPVNVESLLDYCAKTDARKDGFRDRLHKLEMAEKEIPQDVWDGMVESQSEHDQKEVSLGRKRIESKEFWWFISQNSYVFLDEASDLFDPLNFRKAPPSLGTYLRHHRHYKDTVYFFSQVYEKLDKQIRDLVETVISCSNSLKEPVIDWKYTAHIKHFHQFFVMREYRGRSISNKAIKYGSGIVPTRNVFPTKRGFKNYESFSKPETLAGKRLADPSAVSDDYEPRYSKRLIRFFGEMVPVGVIAFVVVWMAFGFLEGLKSLGKPTEVVAESMPESTKKEGEGEVEETEVSLSSSSSYEKEIQKNDKSRSKTNERVILSTPNWIKTSERKIYVGQTVGTNTVRRILLDGVELDTGSRIGFHQLLLSGQ